MGYLIPTDMVENGYYDSDYMLKFPDKDLYICAEDEKSCFGRYINDGLSKYNSNCIFESYTGIYSAGIKAKKKIKKGDELYLTYGSDYWKTNSKYDKLKIADKQFIDDMNDNDEN